MLFFLWLRWRVVRARLLHRLFGTIYVYLEAYDKSLRVRSVYRDPVTKRVMCRSENSTNWVTLQRDGRTNNSTNAHWFPLYPHVLPITSNDEPDATFQ